MRGRGKDDATRDFIAQARPDLLWIADYRYLLPMDVVAIAPLGAVNLHPSLLPKYRGRAPVNWAILRGETRLGLTAHCVDEGCDTGDIIEQVSFELTEEQDVGDALNTLYPLYEQITRNVLAQFRNGNVPRHLQNHAIATEFPRRTPEDGRIDWRRPAREVLNLVRAVAAPYPGAFTSLKGEKVTVWKASVVEEDATSAMPGTVTSVGTPGAVVDCGVGRLLLRTFDPSGLKSGDRLGI